MKNWENKLGVALTFFIAVWCISWIAAPAVARGPKNLYTTGTSDVALSTAVSGRVGISTSVPQRVDNATQYGLLVNRVFVRLCNYDGGARRLHFGFAVDISTKEGDPNYSEYIEDGICKNINISDKLKLFAITQAGVQPSTSVVTQAH